MLGKIFIDYICTQVYLVTHFGKSINCRILFLHDPITPFRSKTNLI